MNIRHLPRSIAFATIVLSLAGDRAAHHHHEHAPVHKYAVSIPVSRTRSARWAVRLQVGEAKIVGVYTQTERTRFARVQRKDGRE